MDLNIEGTKHEKAVLVVLSYIAGFTAGFLVFGFAVPMQSNSTAVDMPAEFIAPITEQTSANEEGSVVAVVPQMVGADSDEVEYKDGRLMANVNGASVLLSAQLATVDADTAKTFAKQGVHESIPNYQASDDGQFIYYCEQHSDKDQCTNFVYSVTGEMIYFVSLNGEKLVTPAAVSQTAQWTSAGLEVGSAHSANPATPWELVTR